MKNYYQNKFVYLKFSAEQHWFVLWKVTYAQQQTDLVKTFKSEPMKPYRTIILTLQVQILWKLMQSAGQWWTRLAFMKIYFHLMFNSTDFIHDAVSDKNSWKMGHIVFERNQCSRTKKIIYYTADTPVIVTV